MTSLFMGQVVMCMVKLILCSYTSGYMSDGTYQQKPVCDEYTSDRPLECKILRIDDNEVKVDCNESIKKNKKKYSISDNKLNLNPKWVNKEFCNDHN